MEFTQDFFLAEVLLKNLREAIVVLDGNLRVKWANTSFYQTFQLTSEDAESQFIHDLDDGHWAIPELIALLEKMGSNKQAVKDFRNEHDFPRLGHKVLLFISPDSDIRSCCSMYARFWTRKRLSG
jgi:nitrogen-specific signal transduction histidine kinase